MHPDTNENIFLPLCFAAYTPMQPPIVLGMVWPGGSALNQAFWQFYNQTYNSAVFFATDGAGRDETRRDETRPGGFNVSST